MVAKVILNPYAGRWQALNRREEMVSALKASGIDFELVATASPGQGTELAAQAVQDGFDPIISAGGDGSISEVVNGIAQAMLESEHERWPAFGIIPLGSANDLVDNLGLPKELDKAAGVIAAGVTRMMDLCEVNGRLFDNNAAIGSGTLYHFDPAAHYPPTRDAPISGGYLARCNRQPAMGNAP